MSAKIMGLVWELDLEPTEKLVLLAYADHADHLGQHVRPGMALIATKTGLGVRAVQKITARLRALGYLVPVRFLTGGRGHVPEYRIALLPEPPSNGEPDDTLSPDDTPSDSNGAPPEESVSKGEPDDTLSVKGEPGDTLSTERVNQETRKGEPGDGKGEPRFAQTVRSQILNPPPTPAEQGGAPRERGTHPRALGTNPRALGTNLRAMRTVPTNASGSTPLPWETVPQEIADCPICNSDGHFGYYDEHGQWWMARCKHDRAHIEEVCRRKGWQAMVARTGELIGGSDDVKPP